ncbi:MAG: helix-turn-helix domain-containing protein [Aestuariibaculum sp.]
MKISFFGFQPSKKELTLQAKLSDKRNGLPDSIRKSEPKKENIKKLTPEKKELLTKKLQQILEGEQLFRNENLTLDILANQIQEPRHILSQFIKEVHGSSFYDYINYLKIQYFKRKLISNIERSISDIYPTAGFKSKTTFYKYFKKFNGQSPNEFKENLLKSRT